MSDKTELISRGYPYSKATLYVYCDKCGSFNIRTYINLRKYIIMIICMIILLYSILKSYYPGAGLFISGPLFGIIICAIIIKLFWGKLGYQCRICRKVTSIKYNLLNYPSFTAIIDFPEQMIEKLYLEYWPDDCDLEKYLHPPI